jgi:hypothetical protein
MGLVLSAGLAQCVDWWGFSYGYGIAAVVLVMPPFNFLLHHFWTYAKPEASDSGAISLNEKKDSR